MKKKEKPFDRWLKAFCQLHDQRPVKLGVACPACGVEALDYQYVGDLETRVGYLALWCGQCRTGVHLSRVMAPDEVELLPFGTPEEVMLARIPNYRRVEP